MPRLFVAIPVPEALWPALGATMAGVPDAHWVPDESLHLTLRFVGEVDGQRASECAEALSTIDPPVFEVQLAGVGQFDRGGETRSLWAGVADNPALKALQRRVDHVLTRAGVSGERRRFVPHVTLARLGASQTPRIATWLTTHAEFRPPAFPVERFALYSSWRTGDGPFYREEARYPLQGAPGEGWEDLWTEADEAGPG